MNLTYLHSVIFPLSPGRRYMPRGLIIFGLLFVVVGTCPLCVTASAQQSDAEKFGEGRLALEKHKDCPGAHDALSSVSSEGQKEPMWIFYMAETEECLQNYDRALDLYKQYDGVVPGQQKIA